MEFVKAFDIPQSEIAAAGALGTVTREIPLPVAAQRWTIQIVPKSVGAADNPTFNMKYHAGNNEFFDTNPVSTAAAVVNSTNVITREDVVNRVRIEMINPAANLQDGDTLIRLFIDR